MLLSRRSARRADASRSTLRVAGPAVAAFVVALGLAGCSYNISAIGVAGDRSASVSAGSGGVTAIQSGPSGTSVHSAPPPGGQARDLGPVLLADGSCSRPLAGPLPAAIAPGISECALVAIKGPPVDVLIGGSGKGQREVQVLYQEPRGKQVYLFSDNQLLRVVD